MQSHAQVNRAERAPRLRRRLRAIPAMVWVVTALWASLLLGASLLWPMTYGAAETQHIDMAYAYSSDPLHFHRPGDLTLSKAAVQILKQTPGHPPSQRFYGAPIPLRGERPSFAELGGHAVVKGAPPNQMVEHPPMYYWAEAAVLRVPGVSGLAWDKQVWLMRLLSVLFMLPVPILCWATTRRMITRIHPIAGAERFAVVAAVVPVTMPNLIRDGASVTNESLLVLAASAVLYLAVRVMSGDLGRRTSIWMGLALLVALLTKGSAVVLAPVVLAAYLLGAARADSPEGSRAKLLWPALVAPVLGGVIGGLWWLRNLVEYGHVAVDGYGSAYEHDLFGTPSNHGMFDNFLTHFLDAFSKRIWDGIGLSSSPSLGPFLTNGWLIIAVLGILTGVFLRTGRGSQARTLVLFAAPVLTLVVAICMSYPVFHKWPGSRAGLQGRYIYHLVVAIAALAVLGWLRLLQPRAWPWLVPVTVIGAVVTNAFAWSFILSTWYQPLGAPALGGYVDALHGVFRWSPVPKPMTAFLVCALPAVISVWAIVASWRWARSAATTAAVAVADVGAATPVRGGADRETVTSGQAAR